MFNDKCHILFICWSLRAQTLQKQSTFTVFCADDHRCLSLWFQNDEIHYNKIINKSQFTVSSLPHLPILTTYWPYPLLRWGKLIYRWATKGMLCQNQNTFLPYFWSNRDSFTIFVQARQTFPAPYSTLGSVLLL